jgi:hypothetical protein
MIIVEGREVGVSAFDLAAGEVNNTYLLFTLLYGQETASTQPKTCNLQPQDRQFNHIIVDRVLFAFTLFDHQKLMKDFACIYLSQHAGNFDKLVGLIDNFWNVSRIVLFDLLE